MFSFNLRYIIIKLCRIALLPWSLKIKVELVPTENELESQHLLHNNKKRAGGIRDAVWHLGEKRSQGVKRDPGMQIDRPLQRTLGIGGVLVTGLSEARRH